MNCWEFINCGREKGGENEYILGICPAYPDHGDNCYSVAGTYCDGEVKGTHAHEIGHCMKCGFFKKIHTNRLVAAVSKHNGAKNGIGE